MLEHTSVDPRGVVRLEPSGDGTRAVTASAEEIALVAAGYSVSEAMEKLLIHTGRGYVVWRAINERGVDKIRFFR